MDNGTDKRVGNASPNASFAADIPYDFSEDSKDFIKSSSSSDLSDVSSSSLPSSPLSFSNEPLNDFSELLSQLPLKRSGLSRYYKGKSRTFTSLSDVKCIEDLAKRETLHRKRGHNPLHSPKATISKKFGRSCFPSLLSKWS